MPNHRTPLAKAEASGQTINHPSRFAGRAGPKRTRPVGEPYSRMSEGERGYWEEFRRELPWLNSGHRVVLGLACRLAWESETDPDFPVRKVQALSSLLTKLGATPVDETKVTHGDGDGEDDTDRFFERQN